MSAARFIVFVLFMLVLLGGINAYVFRWARNAFGMGKVGRRLLTLALGLSLLGMVLGRVAGRFWPGPVVGAFIACVSTIQLAVIISGALLLVADAGRFIASLPRRFRRRAPEPTAESKAEQVVSRRDVITQAVAGSAFLIGGSSSLYGALKGRHDYQLEEVPFRIPGLPRALDGFNIAQLSDVHIGVYVGESELAIAEHLLRRARPDLIVLTGDLLDNDARLAEQLGRFVRRLTPLSRYGVVAVSGNHDYFAGVNAVQAAISRAGAQMLRNESLLIGDTARFALLGVDDVWARREGGGPDLSKALAGARDLPRVLLCHNPSFFSEAAGRVALQISGHTHGGQVNLGVRPADYILPGGWVAGRYELNDSGLYVNRGFGTVGPPARVGAPPEVTRLVLTT
jgi:uncharacterized protein